LRQGIFALVMILVHKTSTEEIYLFIHFFFLFCFGWFQIRRKMSIKRQFRLNKKVLAKVFFNSDFLVIIMCNLAYCFISSFFFFFFIFNPIIIFLC
jgi:hypothetical protein